MKKNSTPIKKIRPPLKWAGGKYQSLNRIIACLPEGNRLIEPFVGSGVLFLNTDYDKYLINDINTDLINFYKTLKKEKNKFIEYSRKLFHEKNNKKEAFYRFRDEFNTTDDSFYKAAIFLYINKCGYNGLCRYNSSGELNVPFGSYKKLHFPEEEMNKFIRKAYKVSITNKDFEYTMRKAKLGDVIYCDPPYVPLSNTANFTTYSREGFSSDDQKRLASVAKELVKNNITTVISNHKTKFTVDIYNNSNELITFPVQRMISCNGAKRGKAMELLAVYSK